MVEDPRVGKLHYQYPYYTELVEPEGFLKVHRECHACFYYGMLAAKARGIAGPIESQIIEYKDGEEMPMWHESRDVEIAESVAKIYALNSPDEFLRYRKEAWYQAKALGITIPEEVFNVNPNKNKLIH